MATGGSPNWGVRIAALLLFAAAGGVGYWALAGRASGDLITIASTFAAIGGTLLGFVIAALAILASLMDRTLVANLRRTGHFKRLLDDLYVTAGAFVVVVAVAMVSLFLTGESLRIGVAVSAAAQALGTAVLVGSGRKFYLVVAHLS